MTTTPEHPELADLYHRAERSKRQARRAQLVSLISLLALLAAAPLTIYATSALHRIDESTKRADCRAVLDADYQLAIARALDAPPAPDPRRTAAVLDIERSALRIAHSVTICAHGTPKALMPTPSPEPSTTTSSTTVAPQPAPTGTPSPASSPAPAPAPTPTPGKSCNAVQRVLGICPK